MSVGPRAERVALVARPGAPERDDFRALELIASADWSRLEHAYGTADDVADQLVAVAVGDETTREEAWSNLWGNVHHQGTVYPATAPVVPIFEALARSRSFPDRTQSIMFLAAIAAAAETGPMPGTHAGVFVRDQTSNDFGLDLGAAEALARELRTSVEQATVDLMNEWESEEQSVRRSLLLLLAAQPRCRDQYWPLVRSDLPDRHHQAWREYAARPHSDEAEERRHELENWVYTPQLG